MILKSVHNKYNVRARELTALLLLVILMTSLAACSGSGSSSGSDDSDPTTPTVQLKSINFVCGLQEEQQVTRSTGLEEVLTDKSFKVWGYKNDAVNGSEYTSYQTVFPGFIVNYGVDTRYTTTSNTHSWEYVGITTEQTIKYWDFDAKAYRFFAIAPSANYTTNISDGNFTINFNADINDASTPYYSSMWFSDGSDSKFGKPVTLEFLKPFALVTVKFHDDYGNDYIEESIDNFSFKPTDSEKNVPIKGSVTVSYPLKGTATQETLTSSPDGYLTDGIKGASKNNVSQTVLPISSQGTYTLTLKLITDAENRTAVVPAQYMSWKSGYAYTYIFKITSSNEVVLEVVEVGIRDWGVGNEVDHDLYNW